MKLHDTYLLPDHTVGQNLIQELGRLYPLEKVSQAQKRQTAFDSFDWRLFQGGYFLLGDDARHFELRTTGTDEARQQARLPGKGEPQFWWDFPEGRLQAQLKKLLDVRALLPITQTQQSLETHNALNEDHKTVLRLNLEEVTLVDNGKPVRSLRHALQVVTLRGYESEAGKLRDILDRLGVFPESRPRHFVMAALEAAGKRPFDYSSKIDITLNPLQSTREAARIIHRHSLEVMRRNEAGILADIDSEFLHDYRVAMRRTRSALSLIRGVFPKAQTERFKKEFSQLGRLTNPVRDLDVYLLERERYRAQLPENLRPGLDSFFQDLREKRVAAYQNFVKGLNSSHYKKFIKRWESFLDKDESPPTPAATRPVIETARRTIAKRFERIYREGLAINDLSPDERLHELRVDFKKIRYLLEFFRSLFPARDVAFLVKRLRQLQNVLGNLNDLHVQQLTLNQHLSELSPQRPDAIPLAASLGVLIANLQKEKETVRTQFAASFAELCEAKFVQKLETLFGSKATSPLKPINPEKN